MKNMKTLDEVIEVLQYWDTYDEYPESFYDFEVVRDALHYLRAFRDAKQALDTERDRYAEAVRNCEMAENKYRQLQRNFNGASVELRNTLQITCPKCHSKFVILPEANNALTWDELKAMEGKPVWVEEYWASMEDEAGVTEDEGDIDAYWAILTYADKKRISVVNGRVDQWLHKDIWNNHEVSHSWQAYRKERK